MTGVAVLLAVGTAQAVKRADLNGDGKGGVTEAFNGMSYGARLEGTGAAAKLWLTVSGADCGKPPAKDFAGETFCERPLAWNAKTRKFDFARVSTVKMIQ